MDIYLFIFFICILLFFIGDLCRKYPLLYFAFCFLGIITASYFAGVRDLEIGTDIYVYGESYFAFAIQNNSFISYFSDIDTDFLYALLNFVITRFTNDIFWLFFILQFFLIGSVFFSAHILRKYIPVWIPILIYLLSLYNISFNILRQSLALSFCMFFYIYIFRRSYIKAAFFLLLAFFAHKTSIVCLLVFIVLKAVNLKNKLVRNIIVVLTIALLLYSFLYFRDLLGILLSYGLDSRFNYYLINKQSVGVSFSATLRILLLFFYVIYAHKSRLINNKLYMLVLCILICEFFTQLLSNLADNATRLSFYFILPSYIYIPLLFFRRTNKMTSIKFAFAFLYFILLFYYWYGTYIVANWGETFPYKSRILGI